MIVIPTPLHRIAALSLVGLGVGLAALVGIAPFATLAGVNQEIAAATDLITQQERLLRTTAHRPAQAASDVLLAGETSGMAGAELQNVISQLARQSGMSLRSVLVAATTREADLTVTSVDASLRGGMEALRSFLHAVESGTPILFIETMSVRSATTSQPQQPALLDITLRVRGYGAGKDTD